MIRFKKDGVWKEIHDDTKIGKTDIDDVTIKFNSESKLQAQLPPMLTLKGRVDTVAELPATGADGDVYFVGEVSSAHSDMYCWISEVTATTKWVKVGTTSIDTSIFEQKGNKVQEILSTATEVEYPSAKAVLTYGENIQGHLESAIATKQNKLIYSDDEPTAEDGDVWCNDDSISEDFAVNTLNATSSITTKDFNVTGTALFNSKTLLDYLHPVGSTFMTKDSTQDPNAIFGGTWTMETMYMSPTSELHVFGNGLSLGIVNRTTSSANYAGLAWATDNNRLYPGPNLYGKAPGYVSAAAYSGGANGTALGVPKKSQLTADTYNNTGLIADLNSTPFYVWTRTA